MIYGILRINIGRPSYGCEFTLSIVFSRSEGGFLKPLPDYVLAVGYYLRTHARRTSAQQIASSFVPEDLHVPRSVYPRTRVA